MLRSRLTAAVAFRANSIPDIADRCVSDFSHAYATLRREARPKPTGNRAAS